LITPELYIINDIIKNNPDYFSHIDWKEELQAYLKTNKIPQPAVITKKLLPFIESLLDELPTKTREIIIEKEVTKEVIVEKPITIEKEVIIEKTSSNSNNLEFELESKVKKIDILQKKLEDEIRETNEKEAEFLAKSTRIDQKEIDLKDKEQKLSDLSKQLELKEKDLSQLQKVLDSKASNLNLFIEKSNVINIMNSIETDVPYEFQGFFGNSQRCISLGEWYKNQVKLAIDKLDEDSPM